MPYLREMWLSMQQQLGQEAATGGVMQKMVFLKKTSISQENMSFGLVQGLQLY